MPCDFVCKDLAMAYQSNSALGKTNRNHVYKPGQHLFQTKAFVQKENVPHAIKQQISYVDTRVVNMHF